jgi:hypothetical protein
MQVGRSIGWSSSCEDSRTIARFVLMRWGLCDRLFGTCCSTRRVLRIRGSICDEAEWAEGNLAPDGAASKSYSKFWKGLRGVGNQSVCREAEKKPWGFEVQ